MTKEHPNPFQDCCFHTYLVCFFLLFFFFFSKAFWERLSPNDRDFWKGSRFATERQRRGWWLVNKPFHSKTPFKQNHRTPPKNHRQNHVNTLENYRKPSENPQTNHQKTFRYIYPGSPADTFSFADSRAMRHLEWSFFFWCEDLGG